MWHSLVSMTVYLAICGGVVSSHENEERSIVAGGEAEGDALVQNANSVICGPRCVQYLLEQYGKDRDLVDIVRELQWPDIADGASLEAIREFLEDSGVHASCIKITGDAVLNWRNPALLHLCSTSADDSLGHFVVWLPSSTEQEAYIWDGLNGFRTEKWTSLSSRMSGAILLTSRTPITDPSGAIRSRQTPGLNVVAAVCVLVGALCVALGLTRKNRKSRSGSSIPANTCQHRR